MTNIKSLSDALLSITQRPEMLTARERLKNGVVSEKTFLPGESRDRAGRTYVHIDSLRAALLRDKDEEALSEHKGDINIRLDSCGFPTDRNDRKFALTHNFEMLRSVLKTLKSGKWCYFYGDPGRGKTALAIRSVAEILKPRPSSRATFIDAFRWVKIGNDGWEKSLRRLVVVDDFDKINFGNHHNTLKVLTLIEELKRKNAFVIVTSQYSIDELITRYRGANDDIRPTLDRLRGKCAIFPRFEGGSFREVVC